MLDKKGDLPDIMFYAIILTIFGVALLIGFKLTSSLNDQFQALDAVDTEGKAASAQLTSYYPGIIDKSYMLFVIGIAMLTLVSASLVAVSPIFIPFYFIGLTFVIFLSGTLSNLYQTMAADSAFATESAQLVFTSLTLNKLPYFVGIFGIILMVIMYKVGKN